MSFNFNAKEFTPEPSKFDVYPAGDYKLMVTKTQVKETNAKTGHYVSLEITITDGQYENRKFFENVNFDNPNETATNMAKAFLKNICMAINIPGISDGDFTILENIEFNANVSIQKGKNGYDDSNKIRKFLDKGSVANYTSDPALISGKDVIEGSVDFNIKDSDLPF